MITRAKRDGNYTIMSNAGLNDDRLTFKARGVLAYILSKPDNWTVRRSQLVAAGPDGETAVRAALKELTATGYLTVYPIKDESGKIVKWDSTLSDFPHVENPPCGEATLWESHQVTSTVRATSTDSSKDYSSSNEELPVPKPPVVKPKPNSEVSVMMRDYKELIGYSPASYPMEAKAVSLLLKDGYSWVEVKACYLHMKTQPFWKDKHLSLMSVRKDLPAYLKYNNPRPPTAEELTEGPYAQSLTPDEAYARLHAEFPNSDDIDW